MPTDEAASSRGRTRLTWRVVAAVLVVAAGVGAYALLHDRESTPIRTVEDEPTVVTVSLPGGAAPRCMVPTAEALRDADLAFEGEVVDVGRTVTLLPTRTYTGTAADNVRVDQATRSAQALVLGVRFEEGGRYLVAAAEGRVWGCGLSGAYGEELAELYEAAFPASTE